MSRQILWLTVLLWNGGCLWPSAGLSLERPAMRVVAQAHLQKIKTSLPPAEEGHQVSVERRLTIKLAQSPPNPVKPGRSDASTRLSRRIQDLIHKLEGPYEREAARKLVAIGPPTIEPLMKIIRSKGDPNSMCPLMDPETELCYSAVDILGRMGEPAREPLLRALQAPQANLRSRRGLIPEVNPCQGHWLSRSFDPTGEFIHRSGRRLHELGEGRLAGFARGMSLSQSLIRNILIATAVSRWPRCTLAVPIYRERRSPQVRTPHDRVPLIPARCALDLPRFFGHTG